MKLIRKMIAKLKRTWRGVELDEDYFDMLETIRKNRTK